MSSPSRSNSGRTSSGAGSAGEIAPRAGHDRFGNNRRSFDEAFPGDVVAIVNAADVRIGDTLHVGEHIAFPPLPALALEREFGTPVELTPAPYSLARRTDTDGARLLAGIRGAGVALRSDGTPLALFDREYRLRQVERDDPQITLDPILAV